MRQYVTRKVGTRAQLGKFEFSFVASSPPPPAFAAAACFVLVAARRLRHGANMASSLTLALLSHSPLLPQESPPSEVREAWGPRRPRRSSTSG